jgi:hypothetical protein
MGWLLAEMSTSCAGLNEFYSNRTFGKVSTKGASSKRRWKDTVKLFGIVENDSQRVALA